MRVLCAICGLVLKNVFNFLCVCSSPLLHPGLFFITVSVTVFLHLLVLMFNLSQDESAEFPSAEEIQFAYIVTPRKTA